MKNKMETVFPREAAVLELEKLLATKTRGARITAAEVLEATGMEIVSLRGRIKTWARRTKNVVEAVPGDGYRILTDAEHVDHAVRRSRSALQHDREGLRALVVTEATKLDDGQIRRHEFMTPRVATRVAKAEQDLKNLGSDCT